MKLLILRFGSGLALAVLMRRWINPVLRKLVGFTHQVQFLLEWGGGLTANWFDHNLDLYYIWHETRNPMGWERGVFSLIAMRQGATVLELCCGDGFYSNYFYSNRAAKVVAMDVDPKAIASAKRNYSVPNVEYLVGDVLIELPSGGFDNVVWDSALEYFTEGEIHHVMRCIKGKLTEGGILSGYVILQKEINEGQKYVFKSREDFLRFVQPYFLNVRVFETVYPSRHNLYFFAGDGVLPFDDAWTLQMTIHQQNSLTH
jgi:SAM-dependent methyltransferase